MNALISSDNAAYSTFYNLVDAEDRLPENNYWDANRQSVDSLLFPYYFQHVRFAALSLDAKGARVFGEYCAVLRDATIKDRASVFEGNPLLLLRDLGLKHGDPIPAGYRAAWNARDLLAVAKLYKQITASTDEAEFPGILLNTSKSAVDYVEVHIYGPIHRRGIQQLSGPIPKRREDRLLFESLKRKAKEAGCTFVDLS